MLNEPQVSTSQITPGRPDQYGPGVPPPEGEASSLAAALHRREKEISNVEESIKLLDESVKERAIRASQRREEIVALQAMELLIGNDLRYQETLMLSLRNSLESKQRQIAAAEHLGRVDDAVLRSLERERDGMIQYLNELRRKF